METEMLKSHWFFYLLSDRQIDLRLIIVDKRQEIILSLTCIVPWVQVSSDNLQIPSLTLSFM